jgi:hypothetical protein
MFYPFILIVFLIIVLILHLLSLFVLHYLHCVMICHSVSCDSSGGNAFLSSEILLSCFLVNVKRSDLRVYKVAGT